MLHHLRRLFRGFFGQRDFDSDLRAEASAHVEHRADDLVRQGLTSDEARRRARLEFGSIDRYREQIRRNQPFWSVGTWIEQTLNDARLACRRLRATPVFTIFAATSLALGVGATTAVYSALASLNLTPLQVRDPATLIFVSTGASPRNFAQWTLSRRDFAHLRDSLSSTTEFAGSHVISRAITDGTVAEIALGEAVTGSYFATLGGSSVLGRTLQPNDDRAGAPAVVVLGARFWQRALAKDPAVIGRVLRIGGRPFEVVGVASSSVEGLAGQVATPSAFWIPLEVDDATPASRAGDSTRPNPDERAIIAVTRMASATSIGALAATLSTLGQALDKTAPLATPGGLSVRPVRGWSTRSAADLRSGERSDVVTVVVMVLVALVLLIASANIANLVLGRGAARQSEFAVRRALGASRARLIREIVIENAILAALSGVGAYAVTRSLCVWLAVDLPVSRGTLVHLNPEVSLSALAVSAGALLTALVVFGVGPAWQLTRSSTVAFRGTYTTTATWGTRRRSVAWQTAISMALILIAGFFARVTLGRLGQDSGIDIDRLAVGIISFKGNGWSEARARPVIDAIVNAAAQQPGVEVASLSSGLPMGLNFTPVASIATPDRPFENGRSAPEAWLVTATTQIFRTIGVPIVRGRAFDGRDVQDAPPVAVLSEVTARQVFGDADPIGRQILVRNRVNMLDKKTVSQLSVIGVARDTDTDVVSPDRRNGTIYLPFAQHYEPSLAFVMRTNGDPAHLVDPMRRVVTMADPDLAMLPTAGTGRLMLLPMWELTRIAAGLSGSLAGLAILLSMIGLYGVLSQVVSGRTREMGIRRALGAMPHEIRRLVIGDGLRPVLQGIGTGLLFGTLCRLMLRVAYPPMPVLDLVGSLLASALLTGAAFIACYPPARRASRVEASVALKEL